MSRPPGHRQIERRIRQNERLPTLLGSVVPVPQGIDELMAQGLGLKDAAVEEDCLGLSAVRRGRETRAVRRETRAAQRRARADREDAFSETLPDGE